MNPQLQRREAHIAIDLELIGQHDLGGQRRRTVEPDTRKPFARVVGEQQIELEMAVFEPLLLPHEKPILKERHSEALSPDLLAEYLRRLKAHIGWAKWAVSKKDRGEQCGLDQLIGNLVQ